MAKNTQARLFDTSAADKASGYSAKDIEVLEGVEPRPAFRTNLTEFGESGDLRRAFPAMIAASLDDIATSAPPRTVGVWENHRIVRSLKRSAASVGR
jgi:hypothetical protein